MATVISRPFRFAEHDAYVVPGSDASKWAPVAPRAASPSGEPRRVKNKWIYVLRRLGTSFELYAEYFADAGGALSVYPGRDARAQARDKRGAPVATGSDECTLPHTVNGSRAFYTFLVSRIRLPGDSIAALESDLPPGLQHDLDLATDAGFVPLGKEVGATSETTWWIGVTDPATIALRLHNEYEQACNQLLFFTCEFKGQAADQAQRVRDRHKAVLLAKLLKSVLDGDPSDRLGLDNEIKGGRGAVAQFITDYEATLDQLVKARDRAGEPLCFFLGGKLLDFVEESYRFVEAEDYHLWLEIFAASMERLGECALGKARLGKLVESPTYPVREYVLRTSAAPDAQFAVGRKCNGAIVNLWRELAPAMLAKKAPEAAKRLADALKHIAKVEIVKTVTRTVTYTYKKKNGNLRTVTKDVTEIVKVEDVEAKLSKWAKDGVAGKSLERLAMGIEVVNLVLAIQGWLTADPQDSRLAALNAFGSMLDAVSAFNCLLRISERAIKLVGALSAAIDAYFASLDGLKAYDRDDTSSAIGFAAIAVGSVLTLAGCACAVLGIGAASTGVGVPLALLLEVLGAVLVAAGWLLAILTGDSDIEQFVSHCRFGVSSQSTSRDPKNKPKWATAAFGEWSNAVSGLDHQVSSLMLLLGGFHVKATERTSVRVTLSLVLPDSKLKLKFKTLYNANIKHDVELVVDIGKRTMSQVSGDPQDLGLLTVGDANGRTFVDVEAYWPKPQRPSMAVQVIQCDCTVLLALDDKLTVPPDGQPFAYRVDALNTILSDEAWSYD